MEVLAFIPSLGKVLLDLKGKFDQDRDNKNEIKELELFIKDYDEHIPALEKRFEQGGGNSMGVAALKVLKGDIRKATKKLQQWSTNKTFFGILNSEERMKKLVHLHSKVMASVQKNLGIATLSTLMDVRESQTTILNSISDSNAQLKFFLSECIGNMHGSVIRVVKEEVMQAGKMSFADQKFWEEVLAAVNQRETETHYFYMDPILSELMIDPVVASNGHTYCRWTIIDNNMKKNPYNLSEDLTILVDNLTVRPRLFEEFPKQLEEFCERREKFRSKALALFSKDLLGDAAVALQYVLQWNKNDEECATALLQVHEQLKKIKGASLSASSSSCDSSSEDEFDNLEIITNRNVEVAVKDYQKGPCNDNTRPGVDQIFSPKIECELPMIACVPPRSSSLLLGHSQQSFSPISSSKMEDDNNNVDVSMSEPMDLAYPSKESGSPRCSFEAEDNQQRRPPEEQCKNVESKDWLEDNTPAYVDQIWSPMIEHELPVTPSCVVQKVVPKPCSIDSFQSAVERKLSMMPPPLPPGSSSRLLERDHHSQPTSSSITSSLLLENDSHPQHTSSLNRRDGSDAKPGAYINEDCDTNPSISEMDGPWNSSVPSKVEHELPTIPPPLPPRSSSRLLGHSQQSSSPISSSKMEDNDNFIDVSVSEPVDLAYPSQRSSSHISSSEMEDGISLAEEQFIDPEVANKIKTDFFTHFYKFQVQRSAQR